MKKALKKITQREIAAKGVQALADRPNRKAAYGVGGLTAVALKLWFDKLATFLAGKINEIMDTMAAEDAASYIRIALDDLGVESLQDLVDAMGSGDFADKILYVIPGGEGADAVTLQAYIDGIYAELVRLNTAANGADRRLTTAEASITTLDGRVETLEGEVDGLQEADVAMGQRMTAVEAKTAAVTMRPGGKNLFDKSQAAEDDIWNSDGSTSVVYNFWRSGLITVTGGQTYTISGGLVTGQFWLDASRRVIGQSSIIGVTVTVTAPLGACYLALDFSGADFETEAGKTQVEKGTEATDYEAYFEVGDIASEAYVKSRCPVRFVRSYTEVTPGWVNTQLRAGHRVEVFVDEGNADAGTARRKTFTSFYYGMYDNLISDSLEDGEWVQLYGDLYGDTWDIYARGVPAVQAELRAVEEKVAGVAMKPGENLFDVATAVSGETWNKGTGGTISITGFTRSDYIPIEPGVEYVVANSSRGSYVIVYVWFDADKIYVAGDNFNPLLSASSASSAKITAPNTARYLGIGMSTAAAGTTSVYREVSDIASEAYVRAYVDEAVAEITASVLDPLEAMIDESGVLEE